MCATCGCGKDTPATVLNLQTGAEIVLSRGGHHHHHHHDHEHRHHDDGTRHSHSHAERHAHAHAGTTVDLEKRILEKNDALVERNRAWFAAREILAVNLVSAPGSGKTTLLERTIRALKDELPLSVLEGDQATVNDAERIRAAGAAVVQINTGAGCHLEADMVARGVSELKPKAGSVLLIENVGNLVCPALFDLGERAKIVVFSVTEGDDKPLKYPHMFRAADVMILNKIDLLPHVDFDLTRAIANARKVNPKITTYRVSAKTGEGLDAWYGWLRGEAAAVKEAALT